MCKVMTGITKQKRKLKSRETERKRDRLTDSRGQAGDRQLRQSINCWQATYENERERVRHTVTAISRQTDVRSFVRTQEVAHYQA